jgi:hypothetical protein
MPSTARKIAELGGNPNGTWSIFGLDNNAEAEIHIAAGARESGRPPTVKVRRRGGGDAADRERTSRDPPA